MAIMSLDGVSKHFGAGPDRHHVLSDISLDIEDKEFIAIVGFSGSGKSTLISLMAGLEAPSAGRIIFGGQPVSGASKDRAVVFQNYSLMPWYSVFDNVRLAVDAVFPELSRSEKADRISHYIDMVGLSHARDRRPAELSGGMRQRVNVARALSTDPQMLLLDEPFSALDALTRANLQDELEAIWSRSQKTVVMITNDVDEAILLADRIIPLCPGPHATLGQIFDVGLPRPRDRMAVNNDPEFTRLRGEITAYLMDVGNMRSDSTVLSAHPNVLPLTATEKGLRGGLREAKRIYAKNKIAATDTQDMDVTADQDASPDSVTDLVTDLAAEPGQDAELPEAVKEASKARSLQLSRYVEFFNVTKVYPTPKGPLTVVDGFDLKLRKGEFISLIGHSGCGKSTVLSMMAGLNPISDGGIVLDGREIDGAGPDRGVVFQAPSLFPWLSVLGNVMLGVERVYPHATGAERLDIANYYIERVGLADAADRRTGALSSGMQQRVGIARAFALSPKLLLLDEPFGMLDSLTRWELQEVLMDVWKRTQVTAICVTHDVDEAILVADRVVMMTNGPHAHVGKIMEVDLPRPRSRQALIEHPDYYMYREQLLGFLDEYEVHDKSVA